MEDRNCTKIIAAVKRMTTIFSVLAFFYRRGPLRAQVFSWLLLGIVGGQPHRSPLRPRNFRRVTAAFVFATGHRAMAETSLCARVQLLG